MTTYTCIRYGLRIVINKALVKLNTGIISVSIYTVVAKKKVEYSDYHRRRLSADIDLLNTH